MKNEKLFNILKEKDFEVEDNRIEGIKVPSKKYFEYDANRFNKCKDTDYVLINIDFEDETAEYCWISIDDNPANFPYDNDDFEGVCDLLKEIYC